jgi:pimeloyl-ACP methyl ester carboxylesterase
MNSLTSNSRKTHVLCLCFVLLLSVPRPAVSEGPAWKDPSPHRVSFVAVEQGVKLEVLDWGGSGRPVVLLAGGGNTAHVFDGFAPKLAANYHVYGITRRGFGASGYAPADDFSKRLGEDLLAVIDSLKLSHPVLIGHSIAGTEMSWMANNHPGRVAGLIYLDAGYWYAFDNGKGATFAAIEALHAPQHPPPESSDLASFSAVIKYCERVEGFSCVEAELRQQSEANPDGTVGAERQFPGNSMFMKLLKSGTKYETIPAPALFVFANPHSLGAWVDRSTDPTVQSAANAYYAGLESLTTKQENAIKSGLPKARVVTLPNANHFVFLSNEADTLREVRAFVAGLH